MKHLKKSLFQSFIYIKLSVGSTLYANTQPPVEMFWVVVLDAFHFLSHCIFVFCAAAFFISSSFLRKLLFSRHALHEAFLFRSRSLPTWNHIVHLYARLRKFEKCFSYETSLNVLDQILVISGKVGFIRCFVGINVFTQFLLPLYSFIVHLNSDFE